MQTLAKSFTKPTEHNERQLVKVLLYLKGTIRFSISLHPPRKWEKATSFELIAFSAASWPKVGRSTMGVSLFLMGVPLATSTVTQATTTKAAQLESVRLACRMAFHTKILLQQLRLVKPLSLRVLLGGPLAVQLGLSRKARHLDLFSWFGQFQLSKVGFQSNLAESLTYNLGTSGLHKLLPKLRMHTRTAEMLALHTELAEEVALFGSSSGSFFIGSLSQAPAMEELCTSQLASEQLLDEQLLGKQTGKPMALPELQSASSDESLQSDELVATYSTTSFQHDSLQHDELVAAYSTESFHRQSLQTDELAATYSKGSLQQQSLQTDELVIASQDQLEALECSTRASKLDASTSSTRASDPQLVASTSSPRASLKQLWASEPRIFPSLILAFVIIMISLPIVLGIASLQSTMSFQKLVGIQPQSTTSSFPNLWVQELEDKHELRRTCRNSEIEKQAAFLNLLWEVELGKHLADKPSWVYQLQKNASENEKNKQLDDNKKLQEKNFQSLILEKLVWTPPKPGRH